MSAIKSVSIRHTGRKKPHATMARSPISLELPLQRRRREPNRHAKGRLGQGAASRLAIMPREKGDE